jgi:hypothetical protein
MAETRIAEVYEPLTFNAAVQEKQAELNRFLQSGVMQNDPMLTNMAATGGRTGELPFYAPLSVSTDPDIMTDDPSNLATPGDISSKKMIWYLAPLHRSWSTMNLARDLALEDPLGAITNRVAKYWATAFEKRVLASAYGILLDNDANDSDDMFVNIYSDAATPAASTIIDADAILDAAQTMGDHKENLSAIAMHSVTYTTLQKQNLIDYIPNARGEVTIPQYLGYRVIVDDSMTVVAGSNSPKYVTMLFSEGAFSLGYGRLLVPSEIERVENAGYGAGQDILHSRQSVIIHPYGFQCLDAGIASNGATLAELALAACWDRVVARKQVGMAFLLHNN